MAHSLWAIGSPHIDHPQARVSGRDIGVITRQNDVPRRTMKGIGAEDGGFAGCGQIDNVQAGMIVGEVKNIVLDKEIVHIPFIWPPIEREFSGLGGMTYIQDVNSSADTQVQHVTLNPYSVCPFRGVESSDRYGICRVGNVEHPKTSVAGDIRVMTGDRNVV